MFHQIAPIFRRSALFLGMMLGLLGMTSAAWAIGGEPSFKIGIDRLAMSGATYTHEVGTTSKDSNNAAMSGTDLFFEWVASDHFGLEVDSTVAPLQRSYKLGSGTPPISDNVNETANFTTVGANLYFTRATHKGFQYLLGVSTGTMQVKHAFQGGTLGTVNSNNSFPVNVVKLGVEWVTDLAGLRLQYQSINGSTSNTTQLTGVKQTVDYTGGMLALGVYAFF